MKKLTAFLLLPSLIICLTVPTREAQAQSQVKISSIQSASNPAGVVDANSRASIYGSGLSGPLTIQLGGIEAKCLQVTGISDSYAEFTVPSYPQTIDVSVIVTNSAGYSNKDSGSYILRIVTPNNAPIINSIQSAGNPAGEVDSGHIASIYGTGLNGPLTIKLGSEEAKYMQINGMSDGYAEFVVPAYSHSVAVSVVAINSKGVESNGYVVSINPGTSSASWSSSYTKPTPPSDTSTLQKCVTPKPVVVKTPVVQPKVIPVKDPVVIQNYNSDAERQETIRQLQTLLMSLIQQLIVLLQQQALSNSNR